MSIKDWIPGALPCMAHNRIRWARMTTAQTEWSDSDELSDPEKPRQHPLRLQHHHGWPTKGRPIWTGSDLMAWKLCSPLRERYDGLERHARGSIGAASLTRLR